MKKIKKALVLAAGFNTRFLPAGKAIPKILFPIIDRPAIQIVVEELARAGIKDIIFVVSSNKVFRTAVEQHFRPYPEVENVLRIKGKLETLEELHRIEGLANYHFVEQEKGRIGIGKAILSAKDFVKDEPFVVTYCDDLIFASPPWFTQLINAYEKHPGVIMGCIRDSRPESGARWGYITGKKVDDVTTKIETIIEKPGVGKAPSDLASMSGNIYNQEFIDCLDYLDKTFPPEKELYQVDALNEYLKRGNSAFGVEYQNYRYFDTGDKLGYLKTLVELGIENKEFGEDLKKYVVELTKNDRSRGLSK